MWAFDDTNISDTNNPNGCFVEDGSAGVSSIAPGIAPGLSEATQTGTTYCPSVQNIPYQIFPGQNVPAGSSCPSGTGYSDGGADWTDGLASEGDDLVAVNYVNVCYPRPTSAPGTPAYTRGSFVTTYQVKNGAPQVIQPPLVPLGDGYDLQPYNPCDPTGGSDSLSSGYKSPVEYNGYLYLYDLGPDLGDQWSSAKAQVCNRATLIRVPATSISSPYASRSTAQGYAGNGSWCALGSTGCTPSNILDPTFDGTTNDTLDVAQLANGEFVMAYQPASGGNPVIRTSTAPWGPWSAPAPFSITMPSGDSAFNSIGDYQINFHPELDTSVDLVLSFADGNGGDPDPNNYIPPDKDCGLVLFIGLPLNGLPAPTPALTSTSPSSGLISGGTTVTLNGTGFLPGATVSFGGTPATSVTVDSFTKITATSPAAGGAGPVAVTVTTPGGTTSGTPSCSNAFTYGSAPPTPGPGSYSALAPDRIVAGEAMGACSAIDVPVAGVGNVPASATAAVLNVTAATATAPGFLTVFPAGAVRSETSNVNFEPGEPIANLVVEPLSSSGAVSIYNGSAGTTSVDVDLEGYVSSSGSGFTPITPLRVCDSRSGNPSNLSGLASQCNGHTLAANTPFPVEMTGTGLIPQGASAAVVNLTVVNPTADGFLSVYADGSITPPPSSSNVDFTKGQVIANSDVVGLSRTGAIDLYSNAATDVVVDVEGYYSGSGSQYTPLSPARIADTRCASSPQPNWCASEALPSVNAALSALGAGSTIDVTVAGIVNVPLTATAVALTVTVTVTTAQSYLSVYPTGASRPTASNINWVTGETIPNLVIVQVGSGGKVTLYNYQGSVDVVVDVEGYYSGG
jgi:hypothetical protein